MQVGAIICILGDFIDSFGESEACDLSVSCIVLSILLSSAFRFPFSFIQVVAYEWIQCQRQTAGGNACGHIVRQMVNSSASIRHVGARLLMALLLELKVCTILCRTNCNLHHPGNEAWRSNPASPFYDYRLLAARLQYLRGAREKKDWGSLVHRLRAGRILHLYYKVVTMRKCSMWMMKGVECYC